MKRRLLPLLLAALPLACKFNPHVPDGIVTCGADQDCPGGFSCNGASPSQLGRCCRGGVCPTGNAPAAPGGGTDASVPAPVPATSDAAFPAADAEITLPPAAPGTVGPLAPPDAGAPDSSSDGPAALPITCSANAGTPPPPAADRQTYCTVQLGDRYLVLGIDVVTANDPVTTRSHAVCWAEPMLLAATTDPTGGRRPLAPVALDELIRGVGQLRDRCNAAGGRLIGAVAGAWARQVPNQVAIQARLRQDTGLELAIPSEVQELSLRYLGATRNRRGRIVFSDWSSSADVLYWPASASAPTRHIVPVSFEQAAVQYFGSTGYTSFEDARRALRARLQDQMKTLTDDLRSLIGAGTLQAGVTVGPTDATVLLAVKGTLRDATRGWDAPDSYRRKVADATVTTSPYGRVYGLVLPAELDVFFTSITARDFTQLRSEPIRAAYGGHVMLTTTVLDLLADEGRATEFGFVFTNSHYGFLFSKLWP
jgi:hypothetical protein